MILAATHAKSCRIFFGLVNYSTEAFSSVSCHMWQNWMNISHTIVSEGWFVYIPIYLANESSGYWCSSLLSTRSSRPHGLRQLSRAFRRRRRLLWMAAFAVAKSQQKLQKPSHSLMLGCVNILCAERGCFEMRCKSAMTEQWAFGREIHAAMASFLSRWGIPKSPPPPRATTWKLILAEGK